MFNYMDDDDIEGLEMPPERNFFAVTLIIAADDQMSLRENIED